MPRNRGRPRPSDAKDDLQNIKVQDDTDVINWLSTTVRQLLKRVAVLEDKCNTLCVDPTPSVGAVDLCEDIVSEESKPPLNLASLV